MILDVRLKVGGLHPGHPGAEPDHWEAPVGEVRAADDHHALAQDHLRVEVENELAEGSGLQPGFSLLLVALLLR